MITEDYVSFEIAKLLKKKGFDGAVTVHYSRLGGKINGSNPISKNCTKCPTLQMAMKWLREEKHIHIQVTIRQSDGTYVGYLYRTDGFGIQGFDKRLVRDTYEEACEASIKYCLKNLI